MAETEINESVAKFDERIYNNYTEKCSNVVKREPISKKEFDSLLAYVRNYLRLSSMLSKNPYLDIQIDNDYVLGASVEGDDVIINIWTTLEYVHLTGKGLPSA